jgi:hypothetical protein
MIAEQAVYYSESEIDALTAQRKVRPTMSAFGDWNQYDADGNVTLVVSGVTQIVSEQDELANDWGYATSTEQRLAERGDDVTFDPCSRVEHLGKGDRVTFTTTRSSDGSEKSYNPLHGYHKESDGVITCYYCAATFSARYWVMQSRSATLDRDAMEAFTIEAAAHSVACRADNAGSALIRLVTWSGKPHLYRASK